MPVLPTYPGVYLEERPSNVHPIGALSTSLTAFVGAALMGPTAGRPVRIKSFADYVRFFGPPWDEAHPMGHLVSHFFQNGGSEAVIVRVAVSSAAPATADLKSSGTNVLTLTAKSPGKWASWDSGAGLDVRSDRKTPTGPSDRFNLVITLHAVDPKSGASSEAIQETFQGLSLDPDSPQYVVTVLNAPNTGSSLVTASAPAVNSAAPGFSRSKAPVTGLDLTAGDGSFKIAVNGKAPVEVTVPSGNYTTAAATQAVISTALTTAGINADVSVALGPVDGVNDHLIFTSSATGGAINKSSVTITPGTKANVAKTLGLGLASGGTEASGWAGIRPDVGTIRFGTDGTDGTSEVSADETIPSNESGGIYRLAELEFPRFNLLCLPGLDVVTDNDALARALSYCGRERAFLLIDTATGWTTDPPELGGLAAFGQNGAIFYPRLLEKDPVTDKDLNLPPSGAVAGVFARTDATRGVWKAPAGMEAGLAPSRLTVSTSDDISGSLNPRGVNVLRAFRGFGTVVWGARTLKGDDVAASEHKYIPIRRLTNKIESELYLGTAFAVFEPNDPTLWQVLRLNVTAYMRALFRQGAFAVSEDRSESKSFFVTCDATNNPQTEVNLGRVHVMVGFAPLKPAEFVIITITQISQVEA